MEFRLQISSEMIQFEFLNMNKPQPETRGAQLTVKVTANQEDFYATYEYIFWFMSFLKS